LTTDSARTLGKRVYGKPYRGFESLSLRQVLVSLFPRLNIISAAASVLFQG